ncbi:MAG: acetyl-CoA C-acetyltransferase [Euryarchaeota archaeon]|nr:acetyl-CoA C-acetyltransferase [Euryarchaeota archaeon]
MDVVIASACRTPIGKYGRALRNVPAARLGAHVIRHAVERAHLAKSEVEEVIMGNVVQAGTGQAPARQAAIHAGIPEDVGAVTVNKVCASGLKAVTIGFDAIRAGHEAVVVAGGMESMSQAPYLVKEVRWGAGYGNVTFLDAMVHDGLWDAYNHYHMGITGDNVARRFGVTREEQDAFALESHTRALKAIRGGKYRDEIVPIEVPKGEGETVVFDTDEGVRPDTSLEKLARLKPVFQEGGTVTAGNASQLSDGGAALVLMTREAAEARGITPLARIVDYATSGVAPENVMEAPIPTVHKLLKKTGFAIDDFDLFEHNEAYASATIAVMRALNLPHEKVNVHGGAVALGHPLGCTGARILTTLVYAMRDRGAKRGLATLCLGGGNAMAVIVERD